MPKFSSLGPALDGIYFNPVEGWAGTDWPIGTPDKPVNNVADAISLMFARNLKKLYLVGARVFYGTHTGPNHPTIMTDANHTFTPATLIGMTIFNMTDGSLGVITANDEHTVTATLAGGGLNIWTTGDTYGIFPALGVMNAYTITFDRDIELDLVGSGFYDVVIDDGVTVMFTGNLVCRTVTNGTGTLVVMGDCHVVDGNPITGSGNFMVQGNMYIYNGYFEIGTGGVSIYGNCYASEGIQQSGAGGSITISGSYYGSALVCDVGDIIINGNCHVCSQITLTGTGSVNIAGNCFCQGFITSKGDIYIRGNCYLGSALQQTTAGSITITGDCVCADLKVLNAGGTITIRGVTRIYGTITNLGTLTYKGVYPEEAVSINAINASETNFLNLAAAAGFHYTVKKVRLKCANPNPNTVLVRLYELVNGVLTVVDSFTIDNANFGTYFSLADMFGIDKLAGDELKITVQASAGGPYAVTGGYAYQTA